MPSTNSAKLGLLVCSSFAESRLSTPLAEAGWQVVAKVILADSDSDIGSLLAADVLIVDLDGANQAQLQWLNDLIGHESRPVIFNDASSDQAWLANLISKLEELPETSRFAKVVENDAISKIDQTIPDDSILATQAIDGAAEFSGIDGKNDIEQGDQESDVSIWMIAASLGGPKELRDLFLAVRPDLPVCFFVSQRIAMEHIDSLVSYLARYSRYDVSVLANGMSVSKGKIILVPDGYQFIVSEDGNVSASETANEDGDELDVNIAALANARGSSAGVMMLSSISEIGVKGCEQMLNEGGRVWLHNSLPQYFSQITSEQYGDRVVTATAATLADRFNLLYSDISD